MPLAWSVKIANNRQAIMNWEEIKLHTKIFSSVFDPTMVDVTLIILRLVPDLSAFGDADQQQVADGYKLVELTRPLSTFEKASKDAKVDLAVAKHRHIFCTEGDGDDADPGNVISKSMIASFAQKLTRNVAVA